MGHKDFKGWILNHVTSTQSQNGRESSTWRLIPGLANKQLVTLESFNYPGQYLRHRNWRIELSHDDGSTLLKLDATFYLRKGENPGEFKFESYNYPQRFIRHYNGEVWIADSSRYDSKDSPHLFKEDTTWKIVDALAS